MTERRSLPRLRVLLVVLTGLLALSAAAGAVVVAVRPAGPATAPEAAPGTAATARAGVSDLRELAPQAAPTATASAPAARATGDAGGTGGTGATGNTGTTEGTGAAGDTGTPGAASTPPRLLVISRSTLSQQTRDDIAGLAHVRKVEAFDGGAVRVSGAGLNLLAVDPARFRAWAPKAVAAEPGVWDALARGELVADGAAVRRLGLVLGSHYQVDGGPRLRVAASARFGLPGVDGLVGQETGRRLGLLPGVALLVHGPARATGALGTGVRKLLGAGSQVVPLGTGGTAPAKAGTGTGTGTVPQPQAARRAAVGRPGSYLELYRKAAEVCPGLSWTVLAAIGQVESSHGRNNGPSSAGAQGPMQFMPATWKAYGVDGDGDGVKDIWSPYDAVPGAANYLCANGAGQGGRKLEKAVWFYNHSWSYVRKVLGIAEAYARTYP